MKQAPCVFAGQVHVALPELRQGIAEMSNRHRADAALTVVASTAAIMLVGAQLAHAVGPNRITNWGSRFCLDVGHYGNLYENGVRIQQWGCSGDSRQVWNFIVTTNRD